ncbi:MAG: amidase family protein, partial [Actinomycetota bacterium]|nr:amidase family protein [Actinomycetota bacterium]
MSDVAFAGVARQAEMVRAGDVTPSDLVELYLDRIDRLDPELNAYRVVLGERAREDAKEVERRLASGEGERMPFAGVPIAVKDTEDLEGEVTTWGTNGFDKPAEADGEMVRRLRAAGAVVLGKTNLPELAICGFTESDAWGITRNPWNTSRTPGGSSGGSAAATAAGLCAGATGSDGGGSIRIPAALCGLFGLKPQRDRISLAPAREHWHGLSVTGALTRSVEDSALWLDVCHGGVPGGPPAPEHSFVEAAHVKPPRLRIAWSTKPPRLGVPPKLTDEVAQGVEDAASLLAKLGHAVEQTDPDWGLIGNNFTPRFLNGIKIEYDRVPNQDRLEARTRGFAKLGRLSGGRVVIRARRGEGRDARRILSIFERCDVLV